MKPLVVSAAALFFFGCNDKAPDFVRFGDLKIPKEYVLLEQKVSTSWVFDDELNDIALVIPESEIEESIPGYKPQWRGSRKLSLVLYAQPLNLDAISHAVLIDYGGGKTSLIRDDYSAHMRRHRNSSSWVMVNHIGGVERLVATCRKSGIAADIDACDFQNNIESYGVTFHIENGNITLAEEYLSFLAKKLEGWRFGEG